MPRSFQRWCALLIAIGALTATATIIKYETIDDMARRVPLIVKGRVARSVAQWDGEKRRIWTWTELVVTERIKGEAPGLVLVRQPGGEVEDIGQAVAGVAKFAEGEEVIVFLEADPVEKGTWRVSSMSAGKISLVKVQGQPVAIRVTDGIQFAAPVGTKVEAVPAREELGAPELFIKRLRAAGGAR